MFGYKLFSSETFFHPLEVVGRCIETQLQAGGKLNKITLAGEMLILLSLKLIKLIVEHA